MKTRFPIHKTILTAVLLGGILFPMLLQAEAIRTLQLSARPIRSVAVTSGSVWDLSDNGVADNAGVRYRLSGDTLLSETIDGTRLWYSMKADSVFLIREESIDHSCIPFRPIPTTAIPSGHHSYEIPYVMTGEDGHTSHLTREGIYSSESPVTGLLVVATGDTVRAKMTREHYRYKGKISSLPTSPADVGTDSLAVTGVSRFRWFTSGAVPVAVQTVTTILDHEGKEIEERASAYVLDFASLSPEEREETAVTDDKESALEILGKAVVEYTGGIVRIETDTPGPMTLDIAMLSDGGITYHHATHEADGHSSVEIPCSGMSPGRYVVILSTSGFAEKRFIMVR